MKNRRGLLALVHCARKDLALAEDDYRAVLEHVTGKSSAADCTEGELGLVVDRFRKLGWKPKGGNQPADDPAVRKVWAIWGSLKKLGALHTPTRAGARAYFCSLVKVEDPAWMSPEQRIKVIENLKQWERRVKMRVKP
jgi:phage gp16-like protein